MWVKAWQFSCIFSLDVYKYVNSIYTIYKWSNTIGAPISLTKIKVNLKNQWKENEWSGMKPSKDDDTQDTRLTTTNNEYYSKYEVRGNNRMVREDRQSLGRKQRHSGQNLNHVFEKVILFLPKQNPHSQWLVSKESLHLQHRASVFSNSWDGRLTKL